ncbi:conserved hypothetical protein [Paenibacillus curdlanolyticus YK9]|uniref:Bacteriocin-protection, YdeI or OmpD-Associated n=1 Tax=Paenibacillus curdlanolyticus YK9 TaxID=717606 RepID=E0IFY3_9BACL|nr:YdeI/OmpD-associated family protein [Paenibacillus curdlanolyticus]EFM08563.1 conserved hypothetical protein [Paenibacillus curdlanolyticus YK9]
MQPAGFAAIEVAKRNGQWDKAYESQSTVSMPDDFAAELAQHEAAKQFYEQLNRQNQFAILFRIHQAKKPETRAKRIEQFIAMLERGEMLYPKAKA